MEVDWPKAEATGAPAASTIAVSDSNAVTTRVALIIMPGRLSGVNHGISHLDSCPRPARAFLVIFFLLHGFAILFSSPPRVFLWRKDRFVDI